MLICIYCVRAQIKQMPLIAKDGQTFDMGEGWKIVGDARAVSGFLSDHIYVDGSLFTYGDKMSGSLTILRSGRLQASKNIMIRDASLIIDIRDRSVVFESVNLLSIQKCKLNFYIDFTAIDKYGFYSVTLGNSLSSNYNIKDNDILCNDVQCDELDLEWSKRDQTFIFKRTQKKKKNTFTKDGLYELFVTIGKIAFWVTHSVGLVGIILISLACCCPIKNQQLQSRHHKK